MKTRIALAILFCLAVVSLSMQAQPAMPPRVITVTGVSEIEVIPDQALLSVSLSTFDKELAAGKSRHDQRAKEIQNLATSLGVRPSDIQSSRVSVVTERSERGRPRNVSLASTMEIRLRDLSRYDELLTALLQAGVESVRSREFTVSDRPRYKEQARLLAVRAARDQAAVMAEALGQRIGKPLSIVEAEEVPLPQRVAGSTWRELSSAANVGGYLANRMDFAPVSATEAVAPGQLVFRMRITVSFELI